MPVTAPSLSNLLLAAAEALALAADIQEQLWRRHTPFPITSC
jgi:hypothetical protein